MQSHFTRPYRRTLETTISPPIRPPEDDDDDFLILKPDTWLIKLISFHAKLISNFLFSAVPSESLCRIDEAMDTRVPSHVSEGGGGVLVRRLGYGFLGAVYVFSVLVVLMVLSVIIGVGLVHLWVEEPIFVEESLHFDYTGVHPTAVFSFGGLEGMKKKRAIPVGHTVSVSLVLVMPDSDFNQQIGVFQVYAEVISTNGSVLVKSSQPCMLRFKSHPVRLMQTFVKGIPLLLGISGETQKITVDILNHKEGYKASEAIRAKLQPRAGTLDPPQLYSANILINSKLPWSKELVHNWKWTFCVWTTLYVYLILLIILGYWFRSFFLPTTTMAASIIHNQRNWAMEVDKERRNRVRGNRYVSDMMKKRQWRSKKKEVAQHEVLHEEAGHEVLREETGSSNSSLTLTREDASSNVAMGGHDTIIDMGGDDTSIVMGVRSEMEIIEDFEGFTD